MSFSEIAEALDLTGPGGSYGITLFAGDQVIDPDGPTKEDTGFITNPTGVPAPTSVEEWVNWFAEHPFLDAAEPTTTTLGGAEGFAIETVTPVPEIPLLGPNSDRGYYVSPEGEKARWYVLDVGGTPLVIGTWAASTEDFESTIDEMEAVLQTVEFGSA